MPRWTLSACSVWAQTIHCRLSRAMFALMYCARMVHKVSVSPCNSGYILNQIFRCAAQAKHLDDINTFPCSQEHFNALVEMLELGILWDEYGLASDFMVSAL